jgi:adenylate kinase
MKNIIFIAPPAAGKGTQSKLVSVEYNIPHISTGDLLRDEIKSGSPLGMHLQEEIDKGNLVGNEVMVTLLRNRLSQVDCNNGYILDGFPRSLEQAQIYKDLLKDLHKDIGIVIFMDIDKDLALSRTENRMICSSCGTSYNTTVLELAPKIAGICDKCGHKLRARTDDNKETFLTRFDTYLKETNPLINYYNELGVLRTIKINATDSAEDIFSEIKNLLN